MERKPARGNSRPRPASSAAKRAGPENDFAKEFAGLAVHALSSHYFPRIAACLEKLSDEDIWWRPNAASNSAGNLTLHLAGNIRQWITCALGGAPGVRDRDREFSEQGPMPGRMLTAALREEVRTACRAIERLTAEDFAARRAIQGFQVTGFNAVEHVIEHFAYHTGQIIYVTKLRLGKDLRFTRLPGQKKVMGKGRRLPVI